MSAVTVLATATVFAVHIALADSAAIQNVFLDERTVVTVPVATNRVTTISFPSPIDAIDGAGITVDGKRRGNFNWPTPEVRRFFRCGRYSRRCPPTSIFGGTSTPMFLS